MAVVIVIVTLLAEQTTSNNCITMMRIHASGVKDKNFSMEMHWVGMFQISLNTTMQLIDFWLPLCCSLLQEIFQKQASSFASHSCFIDTKNQLLKYDSVRKCHTSDISLKVTYHLCNTSKRGYYWPADQHA